MQVPTLGEVGPCGRDGDPDRQRTVTELGKVKGVARVLAMRVPMARTEEKVTIMELCERVKKRKVFTERRTRNLFTKPGPFYPNSLETRNGTFERREA